MHKQYLGDGVYAEFDGYQVWLTTENGIETTNKIALDERVYVNLRQYVEFIKEQVE